MNINLNDMSLKELKDLQGQVNRAISSFEDRKKRQALAELEEKARALGFSLAELTGASLPRKRAAVKYAHPSNPAETWSGRGRKPRWFAQAIVSGKTPDDLAI